MFGWENSYRQLRIISTKLVVRKFPFDTELNQIISIFLREWSKKGEIFGKRQHKFPEKTNSFFAMFIYCNQGNNSFLPNKP